LPTGAHHVEQFEHGGATLVDEIFGESTVSHVLFLHGWGGTRDSLRGIGALFERTHRVHLLDLPGFGEAPPPPPDWDTIKYTDLIQHYILERIRSRVVLVGHSFGGRVAVRLAARRLPQATAIVLLGVPGLPVPGFSWLRYRRKAIQLLRRVLTGLRPLTGRSLLEWHTNTFGSKDYLAAGPLRPVLVRVVNEDLTESVDAIDCPTLLLWGTDDVETPPQTAREYARHLGGHATLELLPHKDHHVYTGTGAHLCAFKIRTWLQAHAGA
jgi:pimeloyl-ACP methyl ester carboxylesterase